VCLQTLSRVASLCPRLAPYGLVWGLPASSACSVCEPAGTNESMTATTDCLFCKLVREGDHVRAAEGFVAVRDINPKAETHLLVIPERHVPSFREIGDFPADEAKRMLEFVADIARDAGLEDYRVLVNVGEGGGQTIFHLHWHVLGGALRGMPL
jgi:histidine triad (HIT) family protein